MGTVGKSSLREQQCFTGRDHLTEHPVHLFHSITARPPSLLFLVLEAAKPQSQRQDHHKESVLSTFP